MRSKQREIRGDKQFQQEPLALDLPSLLRNDGATPRGRQNAAQTITRGPNALCERSLRAQLYRGLAGDHLALGFWICPDMRNDEPLHGLGVNQATDAETGTRRIVCNDRQILAALPNELANQPMRRADAHETADQERRTVGNFLDRDR